MYLLLFLVFTVNPYNSRAAYIQNDFDLFPDLPLGVPNSENPVCREQSELFVHSLKNLTLWAHESKFHIKIKNKIGRSKNK